MKSKITSLLLVIFISAFWVQTEATEQPPQQSTGYEKAGKSLANIRQHLVREFGFDTSEDEESAIVLSAESKPISLSDSIKDLKQKITELYIDKQNFLSQQYNTLEEEIKSESSRFNYEYARVQAGIGRKYVGVYAEDIKQSVELRENLHRNMQKNLDKLKAAKELSEDLVRINTMLQKLDPGNLKIYTAAVSTFSANAYYYVFRISSLESKIKVEALTIQNLQP